VKSDAAVARTPDSAPFPATDSGPANAIWAAYFSQHRPAPRAVARQVDQLLKAQQYEHAIELMQAAVIEGQSQPWMYEALAVAMQAAGRPEADIERVVLSLADFGTADFGSLTFSAAYLVRLGRESAGLRLYREASRLLPEQPEPYVLGLKLARRLGDVDGVQWAVAGVLQHAWTHDYKTLHREAENAAAEFQQRLAKTGDAARAARFQQSVTTARQRDLVARLVWNGPGDLDLRIEEPSLTVCSFQSPQTAGGGILVHDGYGPQADNCYEEYVCPQGLTGDYRFIVKHVWGEIVGRRATLTIIEHQGTPQERVTTQPIALGAEDAVVRVKLADGRRQTPRVTAAAVSAATALPPKTGRRRTLSPAAQQAAAELAASREQLGQFEIRRTGAIGFQPVITIIPEGETFTAQAIVSPDRRYVRIGINPTFSNLIRTETFTFFGPLGGTGPGPTQPAGNAP
jgi:hypothetical protein